MTLQLHFKAWLRVKAKVRRFLTTINDERHCWHQSTGLHFKEYIFTYALTQQTPRQSLKVQYTHRNAIRVRDQKE